MVLLLDLKTKIRQKFRKISLVSPKFLNFFIFDWSKIRITENFEISRDSIFPKLTIFYSKLSVNSCRKI